jgi:hypothetical protein
VNGSDASIPKILTAALVIFGAGVLTGGVTVGVANRAARGGRPAVAKVLEPQPGMTSGPVLDRVLPNIRPPGAARLDQSERIARELDLSPDQSAELKRILAASRARLVKVWKPLLPEAQAEVDDFQRKLREILSPEQREKLDRMQPPRGKIRPGP